MCSFLFYVQIEKMGTIIKTDGREQQVRPVNGRQFELGELAELLGGYANILNLNDGRVMAINPYNAMKFNVNFQATEIAVEAGVLPDGDILVGDVLICYEKEVEL